MLNAISDRLAGIGSAIRGGRRSDPTADVPRLDDYRKLTRDDWMQMNDATLAKNMQAYRGAVISDGRSNLNMSSFPDEMARTLAMSRINKDTENHPPFGKSSVDLGLAMEKFPFFEKQDRTMMGNLSRLVEHRNRSRAADAKQDER